MKKLQSSLSGILVREVMRKKVVTCLGDASLASAIRTMIKYKADAFLVSSDDLASGVLTKTDLMGAYYAGLPLSMLVEDIMSRPPLTCQDDDTLVVALTRMGEATVNRLYVSSAETKSVIGTFSYPDMVGLMYRYCHYCSNSLFQGGSKTMGEEGKGRIGVSEVMTGQVQSAGIDSTLEQVMELLSVSGQGELLLSSAEDPCLGVITKSDLILAYLHGKDSGDPGCDIMSAPVSTCHSTALLEEAIESMIFSDVSRLFVLDETQ